MDPPNLDQNDRGNETPHDADVSSRGPKGNLWLRSTVEYSSENVTIVDLDGTLRYANPAFEQMLGYDAKEVVGEMNVLECVHPDDLPHVLEETEKALSAGASPRTRPSTASATRTALGGGSSRRAPTSSTTRT